MEKTIVIFRKWKNGDIIALFPCDNDNVGFGYSCSSYEHVGQHGSANYQGVMGQTVAATEAEYASLKAELESAPYHYVFDVRLRRPSWRFVKA